MSRFDSKKGPSQRQLRVGEQVRHAVAELLQRGEIVDPVLEGTVISVSEVAMSPDLKIATVYITPMGSDNGDEIVKALARHRSFIRGRVSSSLKHMKYMPDFRFRTDTSFDNFSRIESVLRSPEVARDLDRFDEGGEENDE
ncbi:30S ribosome-binding factor RbfA [Notoacmeibacter ruber]|uniref:Ribosome-binding factor A n=1 Tax=Notoacmeibacter ruber TaxID=2670375 RepID=A0A3L7JBT3_9HYPH|nr:30S ribosome-binding factor RbfA [Notoacmeibacter ruber]RLQ86991.1 30S ribosome-binding factor RbfA [Notoacmeibacter ruber]